VAAEERQKKQARVIHARKRCLLWERMKPTRRSIHRRVRAREVLDEGVLCGDLTVVTGSIRWTKNLPDRADVATRGGATVARGGAWKMCRTFWGRVMARGISELVETAQIHRFRAEKGHGGSAIGSGSNCQRSSVGR
jgi:hypothetical protein